MVDEELESLNHVIFGEQTDGDSAIKTGFVLEHITYSSTLKP